MFRYTHTHTLAPTRLLIPIRVLYNTSYWTATPYCTAHRTVQHIVMYSTPCCTTQRIVQHTVLYSTPCCTAQCLSELWLMLGQYMAQCLSELWLMLGQYMAQCLSELWLMLGQCMAQCLSELCLVLGQYSPVVNICTANSTFCPHNACVLCGSQNKQPLFAYTTLPDWFL